MKAFVFEKGNVMLKEMPDPVAGDGEVVVRLQTAGLNRRDLAIPKRLGADQAAIILGSDGGGVIAVVGTVVSTVKMCDVVRVHATLRSVYDTHTRCAMYELMLMPPFH